MVRDGAESVVIGPRKLLGNGRRGVCKAERSIPSS